MNTENGPIWSTFVAPGVYMMIVGGSSAGRYVPVDTVPQSPSYVLAWPDSGLYSTRYATDDINTEYYVLVGYDALGLHPNSNVFVLGTRNFLTRDSTVSAVETEKDPEFQNGELYVPQGQFTEYRDVLVTDTNAWYGWFYNTVASDVGLNVPLGGGAVTELFIQSDGASILSTGTAEVVFPNTGDFGIRYNTNTSYPVSGKFHAPNRVISGFRPKTGLSGAYSFIDNWGLPGTLDIRVFNGSSSLFTQRSVEFFAGVLKRSASTKTLAEIVDSDIVAGILYRGGVATSVVGGVVILSNQVPPGQYVGAQLTTEFVTVGDSGTEYLGINGMDQALVAGDITAPFSGIVSKPKRVYMITDKNAVNQPAIDNGVLSTVTQVNGSPTFVQTATQAPKPPVEFSECVFACICDTDFLDYAGGFKFNISTYSVHDREAILARVFPS